MYKVSHFFKHIVWYIYKGSLYNFHLGSDKSSIKYFHEIFRKLILMAISRNF